MNRDVHQHGRRCVYRLAGDRARHCCVLQKAGAIAVAPVLLFVTPSNATLSRPPCDELAVFHGQFRPLNKGHAPDA